MKSQTMDYQRKGERKKKEHNGSISCQWNHVDSFFQTMLLLTPLQSMADPGDQYKVTVCMSVTISKPNFNWL
jgi:hypothetical protein